MSPRRSRAAGNSRSESGYALLLAVFLAASMFLAASIAAPSIINQGRREKEQQLIWRGNQYMRGIRLYFQKNGRFPQTKDELVKGTLSVHFLRKEYADPMGSVGAEWRMIYVSPNGQLTGSVQYHTLQEMAAALGTDANAASLAALLGGGAPGQAAGAGAPGAAGAVGAGAGRGGAATGAPAGARGGVGAAGGAGQTGTQPGSGFGAGPTPVPLQAVDGPVFGASMIGVASKVKQDSLLVYQKKENYFEWEFIYNPLLAGPGGAPPPQPTGAAGATGVPGAPGGPGAAPSTPGLGMNNNMPPMGTIGGQPPFSDATTVDH